MRESTVERRLFRECKKRGFRCLKLIPATLVGFPDRTILGPNGFIAFVELKRPGKTPKKNQNYWKKLLKGFGFVWVLIDTPEDVDRFIERM